MELSDKEKYQNASQKERFGMMKKYYGYTDSDIAKITGNTSKSVNAVMHFETVPRWVLLVNHNFAVERGYVNED